jgi:transcription termination factor Rho
MDNLDNPDASATDASSSKRTRKPAVKRPRGRAAASEDGAQLPLVPTEGLPNAELSADDASSSGDSAPARSKRVRTRRPRGAESGAESGHEPEAAADANDADVPGTPSGEPFRASFGPEDDEPTSSDTEQVKERPVFVPAGASAAPVAYLNPSAGSSEPLQSNAGEGASSPGGGGSAEAARREERKSWWERKKEKKRQKWLERQQGGGGGGGGGHHAPERAPAQSGGRERAPAQPPPPSLQLPLGGLPDSSRFADGAALDGMALALEQDTAPLDLAAIHAEGAGDLALRLRGLGEEVVGMPPRRMLVEALFAWAHRQKRAFKETGLLDLTDAGHGFIVHSVNSYRLYPESTFVPAALVKRYGLRRGQELEVLAQPPEPGERCPAAVRIRSVMRTTPELAREVTAFEELIPYYPTKRILVEAPEINKDISMRAVDLLTPIGFGQRGLIVAPPRTGKTVLLQNIANSISHNFPEVKLILLLIDERPEEVTDFRRHTKGEVVSSTFDETPESHVHAAEMVIEKARRLVELGQHVVILLDSITRLARAYNALAGNGGKTMSGGIESNALQRPKRFFGSARNVEGGGSITILGTALVDTNSRMDEVIFEEFKGTGNMELHLDRGLSDKRIFPAINIDRSGTRKEELIYHPDEMLRVYGLRRAMQGIPPVEAMDMFIQRLKKTRTNTEFLLSLNR